MAPGGPSSGRDIRWSETQQAYYYKDSTGRRHYVDTASGGISEASRREPRILPNNDPAGPQQSAGGMFSSGPQYTYQPGPSDAVPGFASLNISNTSPGTGPDVEPQPSPFQTRDETFFKVGRVFALQFPSGNTGGSHVSTMEVPPQYGHRAGIQRYCVIREFGQKEKTCLALQFSTYGGQGVGRAGVRKNEHGIIYSTDKAPAQTPGEIPQSRQESSMWATPIMVITRLRTEKLDPMQRINYGTIYQISRDHPVHNIGMIDTDSMRWFTGQYDVIQDRRKKAQQGNADANPAPTASGSAAPVRRDQGNKTADEKGASEGRRGDEEQRGNEEALARRRAWHEAALNTTRAYNQALSQNPGLAREQIMWLVAERLRRDEPSWTSEYALNELGNRLIYTDRVSKQSNPR